MLAGLHLSRAHNKPCGGIPAVMAAATQPSGVTQLSDLVLRRDPVATWQVPLSEHADVMERYNCYTALDGESWCVPRDALRDPDAAPSPRQAAPAPRPQGARAPVASLFRTGPAKPRPAQPPQLASVVGAARPRVQGLPHTQGPPAKRRKVGALFR